MKNLENLFRMNLQMFAGENPDVTEPDNVESSTEHVQINDSEKPKTYTQAEMDAAIKARLERYKRDEAKRMEAVKLEARSEAEKLAKMSEDQRIEHERQMAEQAAQQREAAIAQREADITRRELRAQALDTLTERGLPRNLADVLDYSSAEKCNESIDALDKAFRASVQQGVDERLRQSGVTIKQGNTPDYAHMSDADYYASTYKSGKK